MRRGNGRFFKFEDDQIISSPRRFEDGKKTDGKKLFQEVVIKVKHDQEQEYQDLQEMRGYRQ